MDADRPTVRSIHRGRVPHPPRPRDPFSARTRPYHPGCHRPLLGTAVGFYRRGPVPVRRLVWPHREHHWPWDPDASPRLPGPAPPPAAGGRPPAGRLDG
ncbi:DUF4262 domain-containing protein [Kitasatospora sp. NPDC002551]|uniref:DUF4262 domain-containing protein n=1 Tax=Kitasatospora sp. NPDC002551 TaxID=3154539 RepID=UPI0033273DCC